MSASSSLRRMLTSAAALVTIATMAPSFPHGAAAAEKSANSSTMESLADASTLRAKELIGRDVVTTAGESLGEVDDLVISADGKITFGIVGVGGLLGMGETQVLVPVERLQLSSTDGNAKIIMTQDELRAMPRFAYGIPESTSLDRQRDLMGRTMADWEKRIKDYATDAESAAKSAKEGTADTVDSAWADTRAAWTEVKDASAETWDKAKARFQSAMDRLEKTWKDSGESGSKT